MTVGTDPFSLRPGWTRRACCVGTLALLGLPLLARAGSAALPLARSLYDELPGALQDGNPLVVLVSLHGCAFCKVAREHYLGPMRAQDNLPVVQINLHSNAALNDFANIRRTHQQMVRAWQIIIAPTVLFFGAEGAELAPRLIGTSSSDYYGAYLEQRLSQARAAIKVA